MELKNKHIHFIGIGGISMSALAHFAIANGAIISGSDIQENEETSKLRELGCNIYVGHNSENIKDYVEFVVYSSSIKKDNEEYKEAVFRNLYMMTRADFLAEISKKYKNVIAVAGSHGKTTTTAMLAKILIDAGMDPTVHIGGNWSEIGGNYRLGGSKYFVTEACEYDKSFLSLRPMYLIITNIDWDHVDTYPTPELYKGAFNILLKRCKMDGCVISDIQTINKNAKCNSKIVKISEKHIQNIKSYKKYCYSYDFYFAGESVQDIELSVPGEFNVYNSAKVVALALALGVSKEIIKESLKNFTGVCRRFEKAGTFCGGDVIVDYAHHPTEIKENIHLVKENVGGKLHCVFQPHTFSRTSVLWHDFCAAFDEVDDLILYPIYPAREWPMPNVTSEKLAHAIAQRGISCRYLDSFAKIKSWLASVVSPGDVVLILGAGNIANLRDVIV